MPAIRHLVVIAAEPGAVYRAVTEQEGLRGWWTVTARAEPVVGSVAEFVFGDRYHDRMEITELDEPRTVAWRCLDGDAEWVGTTFRFEIEPGPEGTILRFTHGGWRGRTDFMASCNTQWGRYMFSLKRYCETGRGTPFAG